MPKRPRQHQLERESREAFRSLLPTTWLPREVTPDYGIDEHVEIFNEAGIATGRGFYVQLKGTDETSLDKALAVRLKTTTSTYLREQELPVLIVRYRSPTRQLYARWFHTFDPHYAQGDQQSFTFRLAPENQWDESTPELLLEEVDRYRLLKSRRLAFPVTIHLQVPAQGVHGVGRSTLRLGVRNLLASVADVVRLSVGAEEAEESHRITTIRVSEDETVVNYGSAPTVTLHHTADYSQDDVRNAIPADVIIALALWLGQVGATTEAARLSARAAAESNVVGDLETLFRVLGFFVQSHRPVEALELAEKVRTQGRPFEADILGSALLFHVKSHTAAEQASVEAFLRTACSRADASEDQSIARAAYYSLGNFLRSRDDEEAFACYCRAAELDPRYLDRPYFCGEVAGLFFLLGEYESAAEFYARATELGTDPLTKALKADAVMFAGRYGEASALLQEYLTEVDGPPAEFVLKSVLLPELVAQIGEEQARFPQKAVDLAGVPLDEAPDPSSFNAALAEDALCSLAWFNMGVQLSRRDERDAALRAFLWAALISTADVEAWSNAFGLSLSSAVNFDLAPVILDAAYRLNGSKLVERVIFHAHSQPAGFPVDEYLEVIDTLLSELPHGANTPTLRFLGEGADYHEFDLGPPTGASGGPDSRSEDDDEQPSDEGVTP